MTQNKRCHNHNQITRTSAVHAGTGPYPAPESQPPNHNPVQTGAAQQKLETSKDLSPHNASVIPPQLLAAAMETLLSPSTLFAPSLRGSRRPSLAASVSSRSTVVSCALKRPQAGAGAVAASSSHGDGGVVGRGWMSFLHHGLAAAALSLAISLAPAPAPAVASEFDVLNDGPPVDSYVVDDAGVLSRVTKSDVKRLARDLEARKNIRLNFITVRKLTVRTYAAPPPALQLQLACIHAAGHVVCKADPWIKSVAEQS